MKKQDFDTTIEESKRKFQGAFFTPKHLVDTAHEYMTNILGENWKDGLVWDSSCGTSNLTKDYEFKNLIKSTLEEEELEIAKEFNPGAKHFVFDFLNDELPEWLIDKIKEEGEITFFINPPYAAAGASQGNGSNKKGVSKTLTNLRMNKNKMGKCSQDLMGQFIYRVYEIQQELDVKVNLGLFSKATLLSAPSYSKFRPKFFNYFQYRDGFFVNASKHFTGITTPWPLLFTVFTEKDDSIVEEEVEVIEKETKEYYQDLYKKFSANSLVYSLFCPGASYQGSLRQITYKNKKWDIPNEFFPFRIDEIEVIAKEIKYKALLKDIEKYGQEERHMSKLLNDTDIHYDLLTDTAKELLDDYYDLLDLSMEKRMKLDKDHPEAFLYTWDAGFDQLKKYVFKPFFKDEYDALILKYKEFEKELQPMIYELGFLRK